MLVLYYQLSHGQALQQGLEARNVEARLLSGRHPPEHRRAIIQELVEGDVQVIVASTIFTKGINVPELEAIVNAAGWKSAQDVAQKMGRGMRRKKTGENRVVIVDPFDLGSRILTHHSEARQKLYESRGFPVRRGPLDSLDDGLR